MKVAIVHDWLVSYAGSERVVYEICHMYPDAPIYTSVYDEKAVGRYFPKERVRTTFLQKIPISRRYYKILLPLMPVAFENLDLTEYDLVISSSHACSKGVITRSDAVHICYCHTPIRYVWSHYHEYLETVRFRVTRLIATLVLHRLRQWDFAAAQRVDHFIANSNVVRERIKKYYGRDSALIHPPVSLSPGPSSTEYEYDDYFLSVGRLVSYKRVDLAVKACTQLGERLIVVGDGPERQRLESMAGPTVEFRRTVTEQEKVDLLGAARGLLFCGEEDFGIVLVEALEVGTPVIGYANGGILDIVTPGISGVLFNEQTIAGVIEGIREFQKQEFDRESIKERTTQFSRVEFQHRWREVLTEIQRTDEPLNHLVSEELSCFNE